MKKVLVVITGFLGDALLSQPIANRLKEESQADIVDFIVGFPQTKLLLEQNPYIDNVIISDLYGSSPNYLPIAHLYDEVRITSPYKGQYPLTIHHQLSTGVKSPQLDYKVYTVPEYDTLVAEQLKNLPALPIIGIGQVWKTFDFRCYDSTALTNLLLEKYNVLGIGHPPGVSHIDIATMEESEKTFAYQASLCKHLDLMIGSEGGLTNLAAGVGCKVLYTTDFTYTLSGPEGTHYRHPNPIEVLGPRAYFPDSNHKSLDYSIHPDRYVEKILEEIDNIL